MDKPLLIFDGSCPICLASVRKVRDLDRYGKIELVSIDEAETGSIEKLPSRTELERQIHLILPDGMKSTGSEALARVAEMLPSIEPVGRFLSLPVIRTVAGYVYRFIAGRRMAISRLLSGKPD